MEEEDEPVRGRLKDESRTVAVRGRVPRAFFDWFDGQTGNTKDQREMLCRCRFEEVEG
jgi:hypothetical protein